MFCERTFAARKFQQKKNAIRESETEPRDGVWGRGQIHNKLERAPRHVVAVLFIKGLLACPTLCGAAASTAGFRGARRLP